MEIEFTGELKFDSDEILLKKAGLDDMGRVQQYIDNEVIERMKKYTPFKSGALQESPHTWTKIGSGIVDQYTRYARFQYYGKLMLTDYGSAWAKFGETKHVTDIPLHYSGEPTRGAFWFERMKTDCAEEILKGAQEESNRGLGK